IPSFLFHDRRSILLFFSALYKKALPTSEVWLKGDSNGKKSGRPRFQGVGQYKTFRYLQFKKHHFANNKITRSQIGDVKVIVHRPIPVGFDIKTVSVTNKADGYYVTLSLDIKRFPQSNLILTLTILLVLM
ncbi:hypothetical protein QUB56_27660, partial [Microcoleus sp. AR_TQ3_B6]